MPAVPRPGRLVRRLFTRAGFLLAVAALASHPAPAQTAKPAAAPASTPEPTRAGAVKLPDGTVVFFSKSPDDPNPPLDGVLLSPQEYKALLDQADQLRKLKAAPKTQAPSACHLRGKVERRGDRTVAAVTAQYEFRTSTPGAQVALGGQRAFPVAAKMDGGKLPALSSGEDGLSVLVDAPGEHTVTLDLEAPVGPRGPKGELGFEFGLPRAAITTLVLEPPPGIKAVTVNKLTRPPGLPGLPLGPAESVEVTWETPSAPAAAGDAVTSADADVTVRVDDTQVETVIRLRLRGPAKEWSLVLPPSADVAAERAGPVAADPQQPAAEPAFPSAAAPAINRPADPAKPVWTFRPPDGGTDWVVTASVRQARPKPTDPNFRGPYPIGPLAVTTATRLTGLVRVHAPPTIRLGFQTGPDVRRQDVPPGEEELAAVFRFTTVRSPSAGPQPGPLLQIDARPAPGFLRVEPDYHLRRTDAGWRVQADVRVTPVRTDADQVTVEVPAGWEAVAAGPPELVVGVDEPAHAAGPTRRLVVRLVAPQRDPFALTLTATTRTEPDAKQATLPLPRFPAPAAIEQAARVTATVPDGYEVRGTAVAPDGGPAGPSDLRAAGSVPGKPATSVSGRIESGVSQVALAWQKYQPELVVGSRADVTLQPHLAVVVQTLTCRAAGGAPIRFRGPAGALGLQSKPQLAAGDRPGEWVLRPAPDAAETVLAVSYALRLPPAPGSGTALPVDLLWPVDATHIATTVRVWDEGGHHLGGVSGPWRELPPEPSEDRDALPRLTLIGSGGPLPLALEAGAPADGALPTVTVERTLVQAWLMAEGTRATRTRFVLSRWSPGGATLELPAGASVDIAVGDKGVGVSPTPGPAGALIVRIPLPGRRPDQPALTLDVRCVLPAARSRYGEVILTPPRLAGAVFRTPPRWHVLLPSGDVALQPGSGVIPDARWAWRRGMLTPVPAADLGQLERWLRAGDTAATPEAGPRGGAAEDGLLAWQPVPGPVSLYRVPRGVWVATCSLAALALGLATTQLRTRVLGPALAALGIGCAAAAAVWPQPAAEVISASQPGAAALALLLCGRAAVRWYFRRRITYLPGFTRTLAGADTGATGGLPAAPVGSHPSAAPAPAASSKKSAPRPAVPSSGR